MRQSSVPNRIFSPLSSLLSPHVAPTCGARHREIEGRREEKGETLPASSIFSISLARPSENLHGQDLSLYHKVFWFFLRRENVEFHHSFFWILVLWKLVSEPSGGRSGGFSPAEMTTGIATHTKTKPTKHTHQQEIAPTEHSRNRCISCFNGKKM